MSDKGQLRAQAEAIFKQKPDPIGNVVAPDTNQQTPRACSRARMCAESPHPQGNTPWKKIVLPEGLKRERKSPLNKSDGRGGITSHVPNPGTRSNRRE